MRDLTLILVLAGVLTLAAGTGCARNDGDGAGADGTTTETNATADAFCQEHQIAEAQCPFCNPGLIESMGQCPGHGVPEAFCYQCNAALVPAFKAVGDWCGGHDRPESQCYICNPELDPNRQPAPTDQSHLTVPGEYPVSGQPLPDTDLPRTQTPPVVFCATNEYIVRLKDADVVRQAGLELATVESRPISKTLECNASVTYDGTRHAQLASQVPGIVTVVRKDLGDAVEAGEVMATIKATSLGAAKSAYLQALAGVNLWEKNHARESNLLDQGLLSRREALETETSLAQHRIELSEAEQELLSLGLSPQQVAAVRRTGDTSPLYEVVASFPGIIVERNAVPGEVVDPSKPLFAVADVSRMWALLDVYEADVREVRVGQPVILRVDGLPGENVPGTITWISAEMDPRTRTLRARAEVDNRRGLLRAHMFARAIVSVRDRHQSVVVPQSAVQWEGCCNVVFVKKSETEYEPRKVHLGTALGTVHEVLSGVDPGETVVTQGSFLLKTEILKGSIGAGCCEVRPGT